MIIFHSIIDLILVAIIIAEVKIAIEFPMYSKPMNQKLFHGVGFAIESVLFIGVILFSRHWYDVIISICAFWNYFEVRSNYVHGKPLLYVGESAMTDKLLRRIQKYVPFFKLDLHIATLLTMVYFCYLHYSDVALLLH